MNLSDDVDLEDYVSRPEKVSAAEISAICAEAGLQAVRKNRYIIIPKDFENGYTKHVKRSDTGKCIAAHTPPPLPRISSNPSSRPFDTNYSNKTISHPLSHFYRIRFLQVIIFLSF